VDPAATRLLTSLTELINKAQQGKLPDFLYKHLADAELLALKKGAEDVRPIAMGNMLRKLVSRSLAMQYREQMETFFVPLQFGVGISQRAEVVVHATRVLMDQHPDWVVFKADDDDDDYLTWSRLDDVTKFKTNQ